MSKEISLIFLLWQTSILTVVVLIGGRRYIAEKCPFCALPGFLWPPVLSKGQLRLRVLPKDRFFNNFVSAKKNEKFSSQPARFSAQPEVWIVVERNRALLVVSLFFFLPVSDPHTVPAIAAGNWINKSIPFQSIQRPTTSCSGCENRGSFEAEKKNKNKPYAILKRGPYARLLPLSLKRALN